MYNSVHNCLLINLWAGVLDLCRGDDQWFCPWNFLLYFLGNGANTLSRMHSCNVPKGWNSSPFHFCFLFHYKYDLRLLFHKRNIKSYRQIEESSIFFILRKEYISCWAQIRIDWFTLAWFLRKNIHVNVIKRFEMNNNIIVFII